MAARASAIWPRSANFIAEGLIILDYTYLLIVHGRLALNVLIPSSRFPLLANVP